MIISRGNLNKDQLKGKIAIVTGGGGGIGYEACRSLIWLGVTVVIAEVNKQKGSQTEKQLNQEFSGQKTHFIKCDVGNKKDVQRLISKVIKTYGKIDILINNATISPIGAVHEVGIYRWDQSYNVNLRGPVLLISSILKHMLSKNEGTIVMVPSSGAAPYMGAYEVFKTAQVELANTLSAELEKTGVITFSIGPGIVKTDTANKAIEQLAPLYHKTVNEFYKMSENVLLTAEEAGAGFAASVALSDKYRGLEIGSIQALLDAGINLEKSVEHKIISLNEEEKIKLLNLFHKIKQTFSKQIDGWKERSIFERQWLLRDFKKNMGSSTESVVIRLNSFQLLLEQGLISKSDFDSLKINHIFDYYAHQIDLLKGYEKNPVKVEELTAIIESWMDEIKSFDDIINGIILHMQFP